MLNSETALQPTINSDGTYSYGIKDGSDDTINGTKEIDNEGRDCAGSLFSENPLMSEKHFASMINSHVNFNTCNQQISSVTSKSEVHNPMNHQLVTDSDEIFGITNNVGDMIDLECEVIESKNDDEDYIESLDTQVSMMKHPHVIDALKGTGYGDSLLKQSNSYKNLYNAKIGTNNSKSSNEISVCNDIMISDTTRYPVKSINENDEILNKDNLNQTTKKNRLISDVFLKTVVFDDVCEDTSFETSFQTNYCKEAFNIYTPLDKSINGYEQQTASKDAITARLDPLKEVSHKYLSNSSSFQEDIENIDISQELMNNDSVDAENFDQKISSVSEVINNVSNTIENISDNIMVCKKTSENFEKPERMSEEDVHHEFLKNEYSAIESFFEYEHCSDLENDNDAEIFDIASDTATDDIDIAGLRSGRVKFAKGRKGERVRDGRVFRSDLALLPKSAFKPAIPLSKSQNQRMRSNILKRIFKDKSHKQRIRASSHRNQNNSPPQSSESVKKDDSNKVIVHYLEEETDLDENISKERNEPLAVGLKLKVAKKKDVDSSDEIIDVCTESSDDLKCWADKPVDRVTMLRYKTNWNNVNYELLANGFTSPTLKYEKPEMISFSFGNKKLARNNHFDDNIGSIIDNINDHIIDISRNPEVLTQVRTNGTKSMAFLKKIMQHALPRDIIGMLCFFFMHEPSPSASEIRKISKAIGRPHKLLYNWFLEARGQCISRHVRFRKRKLHFCSYCLGNISAGSIEHLLDKKHLKNVLGKFYVEGMSEEERTSFWSTEMNLLKEQNIIAEAENESLSSDSSRPVTPLEDENRHTVIDHSKISEDKTKPTMETTSEEHSSNLLITGTYKPQQKKFVDLITEASLIKKTLKKFPTDTTVKKATYILSEFNKFSQWRIKSSKSEKSCENLPETNLDFKNNIEGNVLNQKTNVSCSKMSNSLDSEHIETFQTLDNEPENKMLTKIENDSKGEENGNVGSGSCVTEIEKESVKFGDILYQCPCCLKIFSTEWKLLRHSLIHKAFKCEHCLEHFPNEETLQNHLFSHFYPSQTDSGKSIEMTPCKECKSGICSCVQYRELEQSEFTEERIPCFIDKDSSASLSDRCKVSWKDVSSHYFKSQKNRLSKRKSSLKSEKLFKKPHVKKSAISPYNILAKNQPKARESDIEHKILKDSVEEIIDENVKQCNICNETLGSLIELREHMFLHKIKSRSRGSVETVDFLAVPGKKRKITDTSSNVPPKPKKPYLKPDKPKIQMKCFYCHRLICSERFLRVHIKNHCKLAPQANIKELLKPNKTLIDLAKEGYGKLYYWFNVETSEIIDTIDLKMDELNAPKPVGKMISRCKFCGMNFERVREVRKHLQKTCHKITKPNKKRLKEGATLDEIDAVELVNYELTRQLDMHLNQDDMESVDYFEPLSDSRYSEANQSSFDGKCNDSDRELSNGASSHRKDMYNTLLEKRKKVYNAIIDKVISDAASSDTFGDSTDNSDHFEESLVCNDRNTPNEIKSVSEYTNVSEITLQEDNNEEKKMSNFDELPLADGINSNPSHLSQEASSQSSQKLNIFSESESHNFSGFEGDLMTCNSNVLKLSKLSASGSIEEFNEDSSNDNQSETLGMFSSDFAENSSNHENATADEENNVDYEEPYNYTSSLNYTSPSDDNSIDTEDKIMICDVSTESLNKSIEDGTDDFHITNVVSVTENSFNKSIMDNSRNIDDEDNNKESISPKKELVEDSCKVEPKEDSTQEVINLDSDNELEEDELNESSESDDGEMLLVDMDDMNLENAFETVAVNDENINETN